MVLSAINGIPTPNQHRSVRAILSDFLKLETAPECLTKITYEWCSAICKNRGSFWYWDPEGVLLRCLESGFRRLDFRRQYRGPTIIHTEHHRGLVDVVFGSDKIEVVADLLQAWTMGGGSYVLLSLCARRLVGLQNQVPSSPRLRRLAIRSVELTKYAIPKEVGVDRFIEFLNHLHVTTEDMDTWHIWVELLLGTIQSSEAPQHLSHPYWELLAELVASSSREKIDPTNGLRITTSLVGAEEWSKLECWMGIRWMALPEDADPTEGDLCHSMTLLFRRRPGAIQKLEQWMERWRWGYSNRVPESFQQLCKQVHEAAKQDAS